ncbi:hypothetical protein PHAVU_L004843 [Phaseolus vulgaris]|uniref:Uncharacterized protein n=2 Tax=Phaseolus vulgaris TaxID=3885 RepID=A0ACC3P126_PHAVU|nr:hypothetical protein PHAVU_005G143300g [Phaseolus vulgaris]ESW22310.1 hypothetical protein PHAVU_005G143300g [Phaseolus vulgaris]
MLKKIENMAQQDEGGPLGLLQPVNARTELVRNSDNAGTGTGSISFNTLLTASPPSSTDSSSDLDTQALFVSGRWKEGIHCE